MSLFLNRLVVMSSLACTLLTQAPRAGLAAGTHHKTGHAARAARAGHAAQKAAASEHKGMMQQQAALQHKATHPNTTGEIARHHAVGGLHQHPVGVRQHPRTHTSSTGPLVSTLHAIIGQLHQADHDYDGHRVQAIHQLDQAMHTLQPGTTHASPITHAGLGGANSQSAGPRMAQAESDAHLRQAHQELVMLEGRMAGVTGNARTTHHQQAHNHVQQALQHLNLALAIH